MSLTTVQPGMLGTPQPYNFKNRLINGQMQIDQRYAGQATGSSINGYAVDRWQVFQSTTGKINCQQNANGVSGPAGFTKMLGFVSSSSYSVSSGDYYLVQQAIEGLNVSDLAWGTSSAKTVTLSFWVQSSLTGTFSGAIRNASVNRSYIFSYSIPVANTWTYITTTIPGDTTGTWATDNSAGIYVGFSLGVGSSYSTTAGSWTAGNYFSVTGNTSVVGTNGATWYVTGVQLEVGVSATTFDYRSYTTELQYCQRYYCQSNNQTSAANLYNSNSFDYISSWDYSSGAWVGQARPFPVSMRTIPSCSIYTSSVASNSSAGYVSFYQGSWGTVTAVTHSGTSERSLCFNGGGGTAGSALIQLNYTANAEL